MSFDIFVQSIPLGARCVDDIPEDFEPGPIGRRHEILEVIRSVVPEIRFDSPDLGRIEVEGTAIEVSIRLDDPVHGFSFHVFGSDCGQFVVAEILDRLGLRAFAPGTESGIFELDRTTESFARWSRSRDRIAH